MPMKLRGRRLVLALLAVVAPGSLWADSIAHSGINLVALRDAVPLAMSVPEPSGLLLLLAAAGVVLGIHKRRPGA
jgi:hypothetical protein